jgi:MEMO1 family protein
MLVRKPAAPHFYAGDCARAAERFLRGFSPPEQPLPIVAGIVPHAGWEYSGAVAAKVFASIAKKSVPETFVIFGAVHRWPGESALYARGAWATPLGDVAVDEGLASKILQACDGLASDNPAAHNGEHAIEVQLPFVKYLLPEARIVPISVRPDERAAALGDCVGRVLQGHSRPVSIIGSTDLTHYGDVYRFTPAGLGMRALSWQKENDARILRLAEQMKASEIVSEARRHQNACGPGAMAATVAAAAVLGAQRGYLLEYTTSFDVAPEPEFRMAVGYAGILY